MLDVFWLVAVILINTIGSSMLVVPTRSVSKDDARLNNHPHHRKSYLASYSATFPRALLATSFISSEVILL